MNQGEIQILDVFQKMLVKKRPVVCILAWSVEGFCRVGKRCSAGESWTSLAVSVWPGAPRGIRSCLRGSSYWYFCSSSPCFTCKYPLEQGGDGGLGHKSFQGFTFCFMSVTLKFSSIVLETNILKKQFLVSVDVNNFFSISPALRQ